MYRLFIVEDDEGISTGISNLAESWGWDTEICKDFRFVTQEFNMYKPHIVVLDIKLPFAGGFHWCEEIRKQSKVPIVFISSASDNMNIVMAICIQINAHI